MAVCETLIKSRRYRISNNDLCITLLAIVTRCCVPSLRLLPLSVLGTCRSSTDVSQALPVSLHSLSRKLHSSPCSDSHGFRHFIHTHANKQQRWLSANERIYLETESDCSCNQVLRANLSRPAQSQYSPTVCSA